MNLQPRSEQIVVGQEFLHQTAGLIYKVGNVTLDGSKFEGRVKAGTVVVIDPTSKLAGPYDGATYTAEMGQIVVTTTDCTVGTQNVQIGALEEAYLRSDRITNGNASLPEHSQFRFKLR